MANYLCICSDKVSGSDDPILQMALKELGLTVNQVRWEIVPSEHGYWTYIYLK